MPDDVRNPVFDKSRMPSRHVTVGPARAPHRAFLYSMGLSEEQINQPLVGVATTWNEAAPCNIALARQAQAAKKGVAAARGTPREFTTITVTDGTLSRTIAIIMPGSDLSQPARPTSAS